MVEFVQSQVDFHNVIVSVFNKIADNQVEFAAVGEGIACPTDQVTGGFYIQLQGNCQCQGGGFGGFIMGVIANLGEMLLG